MTRPLILGVPERRSLLPIGACFPARYSGFWGGEGEILSRDRWVWVVTVAGYNGSGGYWITEEMKWESTMRTRCTQARTLSLDESLQLESAYEARLAGVGL